MHHNPWLKKSSRLIYQNPWIKVREDQVICPDGQPGVYGVVETRTATGVVAITPAREVYLVGQFRYPTGQYSWEIIEGGAEEGEEPIDAAKRELQEEAGLIAKKWSPLGGEIHLSNCISAEVAYLYLAEELSITPSTPDGTEILEVRKIPIREALEMVVSTQIKDALSIIALLQIDKICR